MNRLIICVYLILTLPLSCIAFGDEPEFVLFTMPKTGTHLVRPLLEYFSVKESASYWAPEVAVPKNFLLDKRVIEKMMTLPGVVQPYWLNQPIPKELFSDALDALNDNYEYLVTHAVFSHEMEDLLKKRGAIVFFLVRDPRDWIISVINHPPISGVDIYGAPAGDLKFLSLDTNQKIDLIIEGTSKYYSVREVYDKFLAWNHSPICCSLRFEALLGPNGGAYSKEEQLKELRKITQALNMDVSDEILIEAFEESFGTGVIFSKGKAKSWKNYFTDKHKAAFKEKFGSLLVDLGYEKDNSW